jgi:hypothetical protein
MKNLLILTFISTLTLSCTQIVCKSCTEDQVKSLELISNGDYDAYLKFMDKYDDPDFSCCEDRSGTIIDRTELTLFSYVLPSNSLPIIKDYFNYGLSQENKNHFLNAYIDTDNENLVKFLIKKNAKIESAYATFNLSSVEALKKLKRFGYNMDYIDPNTGNSLFLDYSMCKPRNSREREIVFEYLKYLRSIGADIKLKNFKGKSAVDLARDSLIRDYLKSL